MTRTAAWGKGAATMPVGTTERQPKQPAPTPRVEQDRPFIWVNGKLQPKSQAMVSVYDHGLLYGDGVFEGIRVYRGRIFKCKQHMERLWKSAEGIRMTIPISREEMVDIQRKCIEANGLTEGYIRLLVTRGFGTLGLDPRKCPVPGIICIADQIRLYAPELYEKGMKVVLAKRPRVPIDCLDPRVKSLNYLNNILAKCEAIDAGCDEAIMLTTDGYVAECTGDNVFWVKGGKVFTPPSDVGVLEGITREFVMKVLCPELGLTCTEKKARISEVLKADEVFLTGSAAEIISVTQIDETPIGAKHGGGEGPITKKLRQRFRQVVTSDNVPEE
ncbi:MAG: branched-chain-amino-acid transaminase [Phycisphaerales bacterium]